jgi:hypothetical protein
MTSSSSSGADLFHAVAESLGKSRQSGGIKVIERRFPHGEFLLGLAIAAIEDLSRGRHPGPGIRLLIPKDFDQGRHGRGRMLLRQLAQAMMSWAVPKDFRIDPFATAGVGCAPASRPLGPQPSWAQSPPGRLRSATKPAPRPMATASSHPWPETPMPPRIPPLGAPEPSCDHPRGGPVVRDAPPRLHGDYVIALGREPSGVTS